MTPSQSKAVVIGAGFSGLAAAIRLAHDGVQVTVVEQLDTPGGRARKFEDSGFVFDMGPSWYWMPDVMEAVFSSVGADIHSYLNLVRLDPSYQVWFPDGPLKIPAGSRNVRDVFEQLEPGAGAQLDTFLEEAKAKYALGMDRFVWESGDSILDFASPTAVFQLMRYSVFSSLSKHIRSHFKHPQIIQILEFPVLFLGSKSDKSPALYSLMNYADIELGTWYPMGGMFELVAGMVALAKEKGVSFHFETEVEYIGERNGHVSGVQTQNEFLEADFVIAGADYHHVEQHLLAPKWRRYSPEYWSERKMSPGAIIFYLGIDRKLPGLEHHTLFFDVPFDAHADLIYETPGWPSDPLFYVAAPSKTDSTVAPEGHENLFILIPIAAGLEANADERERLFERVISRLEERLETSVRPHIVVRHDYDQSNFESDYNAFRGNAYGLANTIDQTAFLKPKMKSKLPGLFFAGQLTTPGPGVPPSLISGQVAAKEAQEWLKSQKKGMEAAV